VVDRAALRFVRSVVAGESLVPLLVAAYDLPVPVECRLAAAGDNDNYYVWAGPGREQRYVLRLLRANKHWLPEDKAEAYVAFELEWLRHAHARRAPVPCPLVRRDGALLGALDAPEGRRYWSLFTFASGADGPLDAAGSAAYGAALAQLHLASDGFASPHERLRADAEFVVDGPARRVAAFLDGARPEDVAFLWRLADRLRPWFGRIPRTPQTYGVIAGDTHGGNKLVAGDGRLTLIDLDICGWGWRAYDAAVFLWGARLHAAEEVRWAPFLRGYEAHRPLLPEERAAVPWFVLARHVWLLGAHTVYALHGGAARLDAGYWDRAFGFLRGQLAALDA
jgi:Ser/Thr protein kinase RdoA (MazF antagonist)